MCYICIKILIMNTRKFIWGLIQVAYSLYELTPKENIKCNSDFFELFHIFVFFIVFFRGANMVEKTLKP